MKRRSSSFVVRWVVCVVGLWMASAILGADKISYNNRISAVLFAGFVLALLNVFIKPLIVFLSLPAVLLSLGIFMIVINGIMVVLAAKLYHPLQVANFGIAIIAGIVIGLVNFLVTAILDERKG